MDQDHSRNDAGSEPLLAVNGLCKSYRNGEERLTVLDNVTFTANAGRSLAVTGPSGTGKSTLLNLLGLLDEPDAGRIHVEGRDITRFTGNAASAFRRDKTGFVFQDHHLLPQCTVLENVLLPLLADRRKTTGEQRERAQTLLERVGIPGKADAFPDQLSGGERQRAAVARALIRNPVLLLCDEPTGNLDQATGARVVELFLELVREQHVVLIMVTHNLELARRLERVFVLENGRLRKAGNAA